MSKTWCWEFKYTLTLLTQTIPTSVVKFDHYDAEFVRKLKRRVEEGPRARSKSACPGQVEGEIDSDSDEEDAQVEATLPHRPKSTLRHPKTEEWFIDIPPRPRKTASPQKLPKTEPDPEVQPRDDGASKRERANESSSDEDVPVLYSFAKKRRISK